MPIGHPKLELLASNGMATLVMPFSITLNARHTHIKQTHTCIHRHTHTHARHLDRCIHIYEHEAIQKPKSESTNIGAPSPLLNKGKK